MGVELEAAVPLLSCEKLVVGYSGRAMLPPIELAVRSGEFWAVVGRNGSGKTTWMRTVLGMSPPVSGHVERRSGLKLSYAPQRTGIDELYPLLVQDVVAMALDRGWSFLKPLRGSWKEAVMQALEEVNMSGYARHPFRNLSEGQKQRVLFARLAVSDAELVLLDEPTSAMDQVAEREAFELLDGFRARKNMAIVIVSHFLGLAREFADRVLLLDRDCPAVYVGPPEEAFEHEVFRQHYGDVVHGAAHQCESSPSAIGKAHDD